MKLYLNLSDNMWDTFKCVIYSNFSGDIIFANILCVLVGNLSIPYDLNKIWSSVRLKI